MRFFSLESDTEIGIDLASKVSLEGVRTFFSNIEEPGLITNLEKVQELLLENPPSPQENITETELSHLHHSFGSVLKYLIPHLKKEKRLTLINQPFRLKSIYEKVVRDTDKTENYRLVHPDQIKVIFKKIAFQLILKQHYGVDLDINLPKILLRSFNVKSEQEYFYAADIISDLIVVSKIDKDYKLPDDLIHNFPDTSTGVNIFLEKIPFEKYLFSGIQFWILQDVTKQEITKQLRSRIIYRLDDQALPLTSFLEKKISSAIGLIDLKLTFHQYSSEFMGESVSEFILEEFRNSILNKAVKNEGTLVIDDFSEQATTSMIDQGILRNGEKSLLLIPVFKEEKKLIGIIKISHPKEKIFSQEIVEELEEILLLLNMQLRRQQRDRENKIRLLTQKYYTNIHPSVQWKFNEAAFLLYSEQKKGNTLSQNIPSIDFKEVHPIYGQADIIGSSKLRNRAIKEDLLINLLLAKDIFEELPDRIEFRMAAETQGKVSAYIQTLEELFDSSLESLIMDFIVSELHPLFKSMAIVVDDQLSALINAYFEKLNPQLGVIYQHRKKYEDSTVQLNRQLQKILIEEDQKRQEVLPHYFQKHSTDGIEFDIYLGQSLLEEKKFDQNHLYEFRVWQLTLMCKITQESNRLQSSLPLPLKTAQLVLWYPDTLDISFRLDEKKFDVDGSHSVRYEIIKKRIDKALISGTRERLTVNGKIAIVYLNNGDGTEIRKICQGLVQMGYIKNEIEDLDLEEMQGIKGLKAIRVEVILP